MSTFSDVARTLTDSLSLAIPPVAVAMSPSVPEGVAMWTGASPAGCRFWQEAAARVFATAPGDHSLCAVGMYTHNLSMDRASETDLADALGVFAGLGYVRAEDVPAIPVLRESPAYVIYGPLERIPLPPDVVLLFVRPGQTLILSEASQQVEGGLPPAMGRPACAVIPHAMNTGRTALSLGCCGARAYLDTLTDDVALYAVPGARVGEFAARVEALAKANAVLSRFHEVRKRDVAAGRTPTVKESLARMAPGAGD